MSHFRWSAEAPAIIHHFDHEGRLHYADIVKFKAIAKAPVDTGALKASIQIDEEGDDTHIGSTLHYAAAQELGASPHIIRSHGPWPLRAGDRVFGRIVNHPGNRANPYLRPALYETGLAS